MSDLWAAKREQSRKSVEPLAVRMRPRSLEEFAGQQHILGPGKLLRRMLSADTVTSMIFHGPPGTGKTTLAELIAKHTKRAFVRENAALVGVKRIRDVIDEAQRRLELEGKRTILFLDEIHRFTKSQQDVLLTDVERGLITLIGATTENPLFAVNSALVSRSTLFRLESLSEEDIVGVLKRAIADEERGYGNLDLHVTDKALKIWAVKCDGDARRALGALEVAVESQKERHSAFVIRDSSQASSDARRDGGTSTTNAESRMPNAATCGYYQTIIPLPFFPDGCELEHLPGPSGLENYRTLAIARLMLDNFPHVKAFWIMQTLPMAQVMLQSGADDIDGTVVWYDITKVNHGQGQGSGAASTNQEVNVWTLQKAIREAGFQPIERDTLYRKVIRDQANGRKWRV